MPLPAILCRCSDGSVRSIAAFGYEDFKYRLGSRE